MCKHPLKGTASIQLYSNSAPGYTWKGGLKLTRNKLDFIRDKELLLLLENTLRGGISSVKGDRHVESDVNKQNLYFIANTRYGWAIVQYLHLAKSKKLPFNPSNYTKSASGTINYTLVQLVEDLLQKPDDFEIGFFIECDLEFPQDIKEKSENFPLCFYQVEANCELFSEYMNFIEQPNHKPTLKLVCDLTNKHI